MGKVRVEGAREIERILRELGKKAALRVGRSALRKTAKPILDEARQRVPVDEGRLKKALQLKVDRGRKDKKALYATVRVKPQRAYRQKRGGGDQVGSTPEVYGAFIEYGAPARNIAPRGYMRGAWDREGEETALRRLGEELANGIEREASKLKK